MVNWDEAGVSGPQQVWGPLFGLGRATIGWDEIQLLGATGVGYDRLFRALQRRRPEVMA